MKGGRAQFHLAGTGRRGKDHHDRFFGLKKDAKGIPFPAWLQKGEGEKSEAMY